MHKEELLQKLERQTYRQRMRHMVELGRQAVSDPAALALVAELAQEEAYERVLALQSCYGSGDSAHVVRANGDGSPDVRALALRLVPLLCDD
jgi:hypothetical protein